MKRYKVLFGLFMMLALTSIVEAGVPKLINFQGILRDGTSGNPVADGSYTVRFRIYDDSTTAETNFLWTETVPVQTSGGLFTVRLGDDTPIPDNLFTGSNRFIGAKVNVDPEMPRVRLIAVPYALHALRSDSAATATLALDLACSGCVGASDIDATEVQRRVTGTAPPGEYITAINQDGSVATAVDQVGAASGWTDGGTVVRLSTGTDNVGIGTATPTYPLHVLGGAADDWALYVDNSASTSSAPQAASIYGKGGNTPGTGAVYGVVGTASLAGVAGIGGTAGVLGSNDPALGPYGVFGQASGAGALALYGAADNGGTADATGAFGFALGGPASTGTHIGVRAGANDGLFPAGNAGPNDWDFYAETPNGKSYFAGKVGIGTTVPSKKLEVAGSIKVGTNDTVFTSNISSNSPLSLQAPAGTTLMFLDDATGNVGVGTSTPQNRLDVEGRAVIGNGYSGTTVAPANGLLVQGSVGIGNTAPQQKLDVTGRGSSASRWGLERHSPIISWTWSVRCVPRATLFLRLPPATSASERPSRGRNWTWWGMGTLRGA